MFLPSNITLKFGDSGDFVSELQRRLAMVNCFAEDQINGFYDGTTVNGVTHFQAMHGLHADGVAGPETLRRLNGVIAGDSGSSSADAQEEEEAKQRYTQEQVLNATLAQNAQEQLAALGAMAAPHEERPATVEPLAPAHDPAFAAQQNVTAAVPSPADMAERIQQQQSVAQPFSNPGDDLAAMLLSASQRTMAPVADPTLATNQPSPRSQAQTPLVASPPPSPVAIAEPLPSSGIPAATAPNAALAAPPVLPEQAIAATTVAPPPMGMVEKTMRFANAMMQKLADYFEAKLPASVLHEVKMAGAIMAHHGMRETPVPGGPEATRAPEQIPARGPEQRPQQLG